MDNQACIGKLRDCELLTCRQRPRLLFDPADIETIRRRAREREGFLARVRQNCEALAKTSPEALDDTLPRGEAAAAVTMAEGYLLLDEPGYAQWCRRRLLALPEIDTWIAPVHRSMCPHCDHVVTNVAALSAYAHDLLADACPASETEEIAAGLRRHLLLPFLAGARERVEWWAKEEYQSNWKIMSCGEAGTAICAFAECWPEAREALALAARGVLEILDDVPPEGDWPEGIGYWFGTLFMGLRFATALRRLTAGQVDLFEHPALQTTGDYAAMLTTPGGKVFNFNDNPDRMNQGAAEGLLVLATQAGRPDWLGTARRFPVDSVLWLALDDPDLPAAAPDRMVGHFPRTGVATVRSGWGTKDTFVGFKCGASDVGHSHLDANSFVVEAGGQTLLGDEGTWPYAHFLGFFDTGKRRWNWDANGTVGHSTLLVDGKGQTWGAEYPGRVLSVEDHGDWQLLVGDASQCYPGLLTKFIRSVIFLAPDVIVVRDVVCCEGERQAEWLLHSPGQVRSEGVATVVEHDGAALTVTPYLPDRAPGWRVSDVTRTSIYEDSNTRQEKTMTVRYRSFAPFRAAPAFELLFGLQIGDASDDWEFEGREGDWRLALPGRGLTVTPAGDFMTVESGAAMA